MEGPVDRVMVGTDRSETAERAVAWAASFADRFGADLYVVQVVIPSHPADTEHGLAERTRAEAAEQDLRTQVERIAGDRGHAVVVIDDDPAMAIVRAAEDQKADVLVVGNAGMAGRKEFLLGNVPNRISHNARCTVIIVNTIVGDGHVQAVPAPHVIRGTVAEPTEARLMSRGAHIAAVMARHGLKELFGRPDEGGAVGRARQAKRLREALEELGPTFAKLGQVLSTRPDLLPPEFIEELSHLQDNVPPMTEEQVVRVMEQELGVPWEDVFETIEPTPLAAGTIAQVHRATLANGDRVVIKVQRPTAREEIEQDLALLEVFAEKVSQREGLKQVIDMGAVFEHLSSSRLLVMQEIQGVPISRSPDVPERKDAARQLLESYYKQVLTDGFFHADPHPGNLMWWEGKIYFLDFGMIGEVGPDLREHLMLILLAFWQQDAAFLTDVTLMLTGAIERSDLDPRSFQEDIGALMAKYRTSSLSDIQLGPMLQEMSEIGLRHQVPLPASLTLTGKALAQVQLATADLDPELDPFEVAGKFLMREVLHGMGARFDPKTLFYQSQKAKVRLLRVVEAVERLIGARPGQKLEVNFRASKLEDTVRRAGRRLALGLTAGAAMLASALTAISTRVEGWVPIAFGITAGVLTLGLAIDLVRKQT